jgi:hypothetical protein
MDAPTPPIETVDTSFERATEKIEALKNHKCQTKAEERHRGNELLALKRAQLDLAKQVISENAAQRIAEVIGNDYAKPADAARLNGSNGHAAAPPNWAQLIAESEVRFERQLAALRDDRAAKSGGLGDGDLRALAEGLVPWVREVLAEATAPLIARIDELEATATRYEGVWDEQRVFHPNMMVTYGGNLWICEEVNSNVRPGQSDVWRLMHKTKGRR